MGLEIFENWEPRELPKEGTPEYDKMMEFIKQVQKEIDKIEDWKFDPNCSSLLRPMDI